MMQLYDKDYAQRLKKGSESTLRQQKFRTMMERKYDSTSTHTMSRWGVMRLIIGPKGFLVQPDGRVSLEYDI